jgi:hypothetical protein
MLAALAVAVVLLAGCGGGSNGTTSVQKSPARHVKDSGARRQATATRPPSKGYGPQTSCTDLDFPGEPLHAVDVRAAGASDCQAAQEFIRRAHEPCLTGYCNFGGYSCRAQNLGTQQLRVNCRSEQSEVVWTWVGYP